MRLLRARALVLSATLAASALAGACQDSKQDGGNASTLRTLDNVASNEKLRTNQCRADEDAALPDGTFNAAKYAGRILIPEARIVTEGVDEATATKLKHEVRIALSAVPAYSQRLFDKMTGNILVTTNASKLCGAVMSDPGSPQYMPPEAVDKIDSCTLLIDRKSGATDGSDRMLALVIRATPEAIQHGLVRGFGYMHAQFFPRLRRNVGADSSAAFVLDLTDSADVTAYKDELTRSFLADMLPVGGKTKAFSTATLSYLVGSAAGGKSLDEAFAANLKSATTADGVFEGLSMSATGAALSPESRAINMARVRDTLIANAYDSKYCRPHGSFDAARAAAATNSAAVAEFTNTERVFSTFFNGTYTSFNEKVVPAFQQHAEALIAIADGRPVPQADVNVVSNPSAGFGLTADTSFLTMLLPMLMTAMQQRAPTQATVGRPIQGAGAQQMQSMFAQATRPGAAGSGCSCGCNCASCSSGSCCQTGGCSGGSCGSCGCDGGNCGGDMEFV